MKAFKYFLFAVIGLLAVSCSEESFRPQSDDDDPPIVIGPGNPGGGGTGGSGGSGGGSGQSNSTPPDSVNVGG